MSVRRLLRSWIWRVPVEDEVDEELAFHVEMRTRELVARGMDPADARATVLARIGDVRDLKRTCIDLGRKRDREMRLMQWLDELRADITYALRQLRRAPAFTLVAIATLALGIGANGAMFALVDATLLRPLPYPDPDRLVMIWDTTAAEPHGGMSSPDLRDLLQQSDAFDAVAGFAPGFSGSMVLSADDGTAQTLPRQWVSFGFFDVLGVKPIAGRTFAAADETRRPSAVVVSEGLWRTTFGADPGLVGRDIRLDGEPFTVIGIVPAGTALLGPSALWAVRPLGMNRELPPAVRGQRNWEAIGRLKAGLTIEGAGTRVDAIANRLARDFPATNAGHGIALEPARDALIGPELRLTSMLFLAVVGFVLLICCANVANLLLVRATSRRRELAVRAALGAGRRRVVRQLLTESLVLSALGGAAGIAVGAALLGALLRVVPAGLLPQNVTLTFDWRVAAFCAAAALLVGLLFGLAPAWQVTRTSWREALASETRAVTAAGGLLRSLIVAGEIATAVVLLVGAGLLLRTLAAVDRVDRGYRAEHVLTMMVDPLGSQYPTNEAVLQFYDDVRREVLAIPGVRNAAWASTLPMGPSDLGQATFEVAGDPAVEENRRPAADYQVISPDYFDTIDLPLVAGRGFTDRDTFMAPPVCIINEAIARAYFGGRSPIGMRLSVRAAALGSRPAVVREIVGVAKQVKGRPDETSDMFQVYVPHAQNPFDDMYILARSASGSAGTLAQPVRAAIGRVDRAQLVSVHSVETLDDIAWSGTDRHRFRAALVSTFAGLALLLAMIGVFGLLAYSVQQRVREFGVRMALGAGLGDVLRLVAGRSLRLVAAGAGIGLLLAAVLARLVASVLFGVRPLDPLTFAGVVAVLAATAAAATIVPAWRAARIDPATALRAD